MSDRNEGQHRRTACKQAATTTTTKPTNPTTTKQRHHYYILLHLFITLLHCSSLLLSWYSFQKSSVIRLSSMGKKERKKGRKEERKKGQYSTMICTYFGYGYGSLFCVKMII
jgi:hypothetical protein